MKNYSDRVADLHIDGKPVDEAIAALIASIDKKDVELEKVKTKLNAIKQLNNHNKTTCDILRVELQTRRFEHEVALEEAKKKD